MPAAAPRWRELTGGGLLPLSAGLAGVELVSGLQGLVVTTAMPRVVDDLGGVSLYGLVFSGYSLAGLAAIPRSGREVDRRGPARPLLASAAVFVAGTLLCGLAPSMPLLAAARVLQGYGGAGIYTVAYGAVARGYPEALRPRMLALLSGVWVISGLAGPSFGALLASTVGWRWAFLAMVPLTTVAIGLALPQLRRIPPHPAAGPRLEARWPLLLAAGTGVSVTALSSVGWWTLPLAAAGIAVAAPGLLRVIPAGTMRARPGLAATVAASFALNLAFFSADSFVPLLLTRVRGRSVAEAGVAVTVVTVSWSVATWWQSRNAAAGAAALTRGGSLALLGGTCGVAFALAGLPLVIVYAAWLLAGLGMGVAYPTVLLASMRTGGSRGEGDVVAARFVGGRLGLALGSGLGGTSVAVAQAVGGSLTAGLAGVFALSMLGSLGTALLSGRLEVETDVAEPS